MVVEDIEREEALQAETCARRENLARRARFARLDRNPWIIFRDIVGETHSWPSFIREAFWSGPHFNDHQRMLVVNFAVLNGVQLQILLDTLSFTLGVHFLRNNRRYQVG